jgi:predicted TIM-barrel fold metal-dependent hydrolase
MSAADNANRPYITITADTHAGANLAAYREYLDPNRRSEFDAWRDSYVNPSRKHIGGKKQKNWDTEQRMADLEQDGVCAEVIFPNTVPPFYAKAFHISPPPLPEQFEQQLAGTRAHNRWLADWCAETPERRAGIGLIHLNDIDEAIKDVQWIANAGLRGGVLLPLPPDDMKHIAPLYAPEYDRLWSVIQDCDLVMNQHSGAGAPDYGDYPAADALWIMETSFFSQRGFKQLIFSGVFERFPKLKYILTESGCAWVPEVLRRMDMIHRGMKAGAIGEMDYADAQALKESPTFYAKRNCWYGASFPSPREIVDRDVVGVDRILWGSDYPHYEGTFPYTREAIRLTFADIDETEVRMMLGENAAGLYNFDLEALSPIAERVGVTPESVRVPLVDIPEDTKCMMLRNARHEMELKRRNS